jgi:hypothetical protein
VHESLPSHGSSLSSAPHRGTRRDENPSSPLHGTRWQPTHRPYRSAGSSTSQIVLDRHLLSFLSRFSQLSRDERPDGSLPAFAWGDVACAPPLSVSLQDRLRFFRPPLPAAPSPSLAVRIPLEVGPNGLTQLIAVELRASPVGATFPVGTMDVAASALLRQSAPRTFWSRPPAS